MLVFVDNICNCLTKKSFSLLHFIKRYIEWTRWSLPSAPVAPQSSRWTWALHRHCATPPRSEQDPPATAATRQQPRTTRQRTTNTTPLWRWRKPPSIWSWVPNPRGAGMWVASSRTSFVLCLHCQHCWIRPARLVGFHCWEVYFANVID